MAYFSSGTAGEDYHEQWCARCVHDADEGNPCALFTLHLLHNYDECNNPDSFLHALIPRSVDGLGNERCKMFHPVDGAVLSEAQRAAEADRKYREWQSARVEPQYPDRSVGREDLG